MAYVEDGDGITVACNRPGECLMVVNKLLEWGASFTLTNRSERKFDVKIVVDGFAGGRELKGDALIPLMALLEDCE